MPMLRPDDPVPDDPVALQALVRAQRAQIAELEQRLAWFLVQYRLAQQWRFAPSTETTVHQLDLFAELLADALPAEDSGFAAPAWPGLAVPGIGYRYPYCQDHPTMTHKLRWHDPRGSYIVLLL